MRLILLESPVATIITFSLAATFLVVAATKLISASRREKNGPDRLKVSEGFAFGSLILFGASVIILAGNAIYSDFFHTYAKFTVDGEVTQVKDILVKPERGSAQVTVTQVVIDEKQVLRLDPARAATVKVGDKVNWYCEQEDWSDRTQVCVTR